MEALLSVLLGIALASAVGFRVFIPFLILSVSAHFNLVPLNESWIWLASPMAIIAFAVGTAIEIFAYFIPIVDHFLDSIAIPVAGIAGSAIMLSTIADFDPFLTYSLAILAGGGTAAAIKTATSTSRLASTTLTAGIANPIVTLIESFFSVVLSVFSVFIPILAILLVIAIFYFIYKIYHKTRGVKNQKSS
jgi:hypothetical protein